MKITHVSLSLVALVAGLLTGQVALAEKDHPEKPASNEPSKGHLVKATEKDAPWLAKAKADYPTEMCVVSDDKLGGDMGKPQEFIYREEGKPDRLVRLCCKDCVKDFNKSPAKFLSAIDQAEAKKAKGGS